MKCNLISIVFLASSLLSCGNMASDAKTNNWILDDGVMELTPEYTIQHDQGRPYSDVYAAFNFIPQKKLVRLRPNDAIIVNGHVLQGIDDAKGYYYQGRIPVTEGGFTYALNRTGAKTMTHSFELPVLGVTEFPKVYQPYATLRVPVQYVAPPIYVTERYDISVYGDPIRFDLISTTRKKDNRYQIDRLPDIQDGYINFRHITERAPPSGTYKAELYRQHRIILSELSGASRTGWVTLSNSQDFIIELK